jgi:hypothetical protein
MTMNVEVDNNDIAHYLGHNFDEFSDVIYILTDWYRPYQMVDEFAGVDSYQYVARSYGKWLAENEDEFKSNKKVQIAFLAEVIKSYKENINK